MPLNLTTFVAAILPKRVERKNKNLVADTNTGA